MTMLDDRQAALESENAELSRQLASRTAELKEAFDRQAATSAVLDVITRSPGNAKPVFEAIVASAVQLCEAEFTAVARFEGGLLYLVAISDMSPEETAAFHSLFPRPPVRNFAMGRAFADGRPVQFDDVLAEPGYDARTRDVLQSASQYRSFLGVPILREGRSIGVIGCARREVKPFTEAQIALLSTFADQAAIALENVRLFNELEARNREIGEALQQQTATAEVVQVINSSPGDLPLVFDTMLEKAMHLCEASFGGLWTFEQDRYIAVALRGVPAAYADFLANSTMMPGPGTAPYRVLHGDLLVHNLDLAAEEPYRAGDPQRRALVDLGGARTALQVPLRQDDRLLGLITIYRQEVRPFSDKQIAMLQDFAAQAVIAIENARLLDELRQRTRDLEESLEYQTAISDVLKVISGAAFDLEPVLQTVVTTAIRLCRADQAVLYRNVGGEYRWAAGASLVPEYERIEREVRIRPGAGTLVGRAALEARTVHILDAWTDPLYEAEADARVGGIHTMLGVPLLCDGEPIGVIGLARQRVEAYAEKEIELVRTFADQAVIAIENARLLTELRESLEQQRAIAEVLQVINASPGDLAPVFDAILEKAHKLCGVTRGSLQLYEGGRFRAVATRGITAEVAFHLRQPRESGPALTRLLAGGRFHEIDDQVEAVPQSPSPSQSGGIDWREQGIVRRLFVPLRHDASLLGMIVAGRTEVRPFSDREISLLENFAAQAVIAMENARLISETREALEQQTATAEVLQVINSSPGDLAPVFDAMLQRTLHLCDASCASLAICDGERFETVVSCGHPEFDAWIHQFGPIRPGPGSTMARMLRGEPVAQVADINTDADVAATNPVRRALIEIGGFRTLLGLALRNVDRLLGCLHVYRQEVRPFTDKQIALLQNFAAQAVIAMENARLLTETREALEQQTATAEVLQVINSSPGDLAPVFDAMLEKATRLCDASLGTLWAYDGERMHPVAMRGASHEYAQYLSNQPLRPGAGALGSFVRGETILHVVDLKDTEAYRNGDTHRRALVDLGGGRSLLGVPLRTDDQLRGAFLIYRREPQPFTGKQIALLESFAAQAVIAMDNARLLDEIRQRQAELRVTFDNMGDGVAMFDAEQRLAAWNRNFQQILDLPDEFVAARPSSADYVRYLATHGEYGAVDVEAEVRRLTETVGTQWSTERVRPDGRVIEVRHNPVPGGGFVLIYSDVTERRRVEAEIRAARDAAEQALGELKTAQASLIHAEKMASLGQLTAGIAHEIKNPLNFVNNFAGLSVELLDELKAFAAPAIDSLGDDTRAEIDETFDMLTGNLEKIAEHGRRADGIVKSMLEHSRGGGSERQPADINAIVEEALNLAYHGARAQDQNFNITLERDLEPGIAPIELMPQDLTRVFLNLFGNGFYAADKRRREAADTTFRPVLKVATRGIDGAVEVRVRDNGTGIPPEVRGKLFQPFFTTKPTGEGTGLGLSISWDIVTQQHGGSITVDSRPGEFTEFIIHLPRHPATHADQPSLLLAADRPGPQPR